MAHQDSSKSTPTIAEPPSRDAIIAALRTVIDPELGMDIWSMGLVYEIIINQKIHIKMTLTTPLCPYGPALIEEVEQKLKPLGLPVEVELVFEPPWEPSEDMRMEWGV